MGSSLLVWAGMALLLMAAACANRQRATVSEAGFFSLFDGKTLNGWEGDSTYWRVENSMLVGEVTPATLLKQNSFIIWREGMTTDFELKLSYRISAGGNSGINYRSEEVAGNRFALRGYQADIDGANRHTGQNYEERGRTFLARRGEAVRLVQGQKPILVKQLGTADSLKQFINMDWNEYHLVVRGNRLQHFVNGVLMSDVTDNDTALRRQSGLLGVQVHVGPPMKVEFKNIRLKQ